MIRLTSFQTAEGEVVVEIADDEPGIIAASRIGDAIAQATGSFEDGLDRIRGIASTTLDRLTASPLPPEEVKVEFGVRFNAEAGAVIARTEAEGHLKVAMVWRRHDS